MLLTLSIRRVKARCNRRRRRFCRRPQLHPRRLPSWASSVAALPWWCLVLSVFCGSSRPPPSLQFDVCVCRLLESGPFRFVLLSLRPLFSEDVSGWRRSGRRSRPSSRRCRRCPLRDALTPPHAGFHRPRSAGSVLCLRHLLSTLATTGRPADAAAADAAHYFFDGRGRRRCPRYIYLPSTNV